jgi:hypothetical protein
MTNWITGPMRDPDPAQESFLRSKEGYMGHPTVPGPRDANVARRGSGDVLDGSPGIPRLHPGTHVPGLPGTSPAGPMQPGISYDGDPED